MFSIRRCSLYTLLVCLLLVAGCSTDPEKKKTQFVVSAEAYMAKQQYPEAIIQLRNALKIQPSSADLHVKLGDAYFGARQFREAFLAYQKAVEFDAKNLAARLALTRMYLVAQQWNEAITSAQTILDGEPANYDASLMMANAYSGKGDNNEAMRILKELSQRSPDRAAAFLNIGVLHLAGRKPAEAQAAFDAALKAEPRSIAARKALALLELSSGRFDQAENHYRLALADNPQSMEAALALAEFLERRNRIPEAEGMFRKVIEVDKNSPASQFQLATFYDRHGRAEDARKLNEQIAASHKDYDPPRFALIEAAIRARKYDEANQMVDGFIKDRGKHVRALIYRAQILVERRQPEQAIAELEAAQRLDSNVPMLHYLFGMAFAQSGNNQRAQASFEQALSVDSRFAPAHFSLAELMLRRGQGATAVQYALQGLRYSPGQSNGLLLLGSAYEATGDLARAQQIFEQLARSNPSSPIGHARLGALSLRKKDYRAAEPQFRQALAADAQHLEALDGLATVYRLQNQSARALQVVEDAIAARPSADLYNLKGRMLMALQRWDQAEAALRQALQVQSLNVNTHKLLGAMYVERNSLEAARGQFELATRATSTDPGLWTVYGMLCQQTGRDDDAVKAYEKALDIEPNAGGAANNLAWLMVQRNGDMDRALELARRAKVALPDAAPVSHTLGYLYLRRSLFSSAIPLFQEAVNTEPKNSEYRVHLGMALYSAGRKAEAKSQLRTAISSDPNVRGRGELKQILAELAL